MKKFIRYIIICLVSVVTIDLVNRLFYSYAFNHVSPDSKVRNEHVYFYNDTQSDLLIIGASRAVHHYNPMLIEDSLKMTCFNAGYDGQGIVYNYLSLVKAYENGRIKTVIYDLSGSQLGEEWNTEKLSTMYPFYWKCDSLKSLVDEILPFYQRMWLVSSLVQYNSTLYQVMRESIAKSDTDHGFRAISASKQIPKDVFKVVEKEEGYEPFCYAECLLDRMAQLCKKNETRLILCYSPTTVYDKSFVEYLSNYTKQRNVEFWDYGRLNTVMASENFKDATHLNITGANIFTQEIIKRLAQ